MICSCDERRQCLGNLNLQDAAVDPALQIPVPDGIPDEQACQGFINPVSHPLSMSAFVKRGSPSQPLPSGRRGQSLPAWEQAMNIRVTMLFKFPAT